VASPNYTDRIVSGSACVVGIDFGTDSVRSIVVDATTGRALGASVKYYPRWAKGLYCDPVENRFRQHPLDYLESMESSVIGALKEAGSTVPSRVRGIADPVYREATRLVAPVHQAELGYWLAKAGQPSPTPGAPAATSATHPYALQAAGRWREAAAAWQAAGCPYEQAAALADSDDPQDLLAALGTLDELGARPLATVVRRRLRALGVTRIPRGPRDETRVNPAGLTARQVDVLRLLSQGCTNAQIASQLVVSVRTVDSHVAAVLGKLGAASRREAAASAAELGVLGPETGNPAR
jgi:DNA-binding CsgD family transcriptional regulator